MCYYIRAFSRYGDSPFTRCLSAIVLATQVGFVAPASAEHRGSHLDSATIGDREATDDPFHGAETLERAALVAAVLERNPTIEAARASWRAASSMPSRERAFDDPMIAYSIAPDSIDERDMRGGHVLELRQRLPFFGKRGLRAAVAEAEARVAEGDYEAMRREIALMASILFDDYYVAVRAAETNRRHHGLLDEMLESAKASYAAGKLRQHDLVHVELDQAHLSHDAAELDSDRRVAVAALNALLHRAPTAHLPPPPSKLVVAAIPSDVASPSLPDAFIQPEIAAARAAVEAADARVRLARREYVPDVTVGGEYNSMWDDVEHRWMVGVQVEVPLQIGRRNADVANAEAEAQSRRADLAAKTDRVASEIETARIRFEEAERIVGLYRDRLLPAAKDVVVSARAGLSASSVEFEDVIDAEHELREIELNHEMAIAAWSRRRAEWERAAGFIPGVER